MKYGAKKISSFTDLDAWRHGHKLVVEMYRLTKSWPKDEDYGLRSQIRRSAVSITSNIAEGFSRESGPDKMRFYILAKSSNTELQNQLLIARDVGYLEREDFEFLAEMSNTVNKLTIGLIKAIKSGKGVRK